MANRIYISKSNPVKLVAVNRTAVPQYLTKHFHEWLLVEQLNDHPQYQRTLYQQIFHTTDVIRYQISSEYSPITMNLIDRKGKQIVSVIFSNVGINIYEPTRFVFEAEISLISVPPGCYFLEVVAGVEEPFRFISEPLSIKINHPRSLLFEYNHSRYKDDIIYETGIVFQFRVQGLLLYEETSSKRYSYESQNYSMKLLNSNNIEVYTLTIGHEAGVPAWIAAKVAKIMDHNQVMIDGKYYTGVSDFEIAQKTEEGTWMRGLTMKVVEGINRSSNIYLGEGNPNVELIIVHQVERSVIFGDLDSSSTNVIPVEDLN